MSAQSHIDSKYGAIVLAVYRPNSHLLAHQISSIKQQTYLSWTCIVAVDGDDEGAELVRHLIKGDPRFQVLSYSENVGFYKNFERGISSVPAGAEWVALSDQDDRWDHDKLSRLIPLLGSEVSVAGGQARIVDQQRHLLGLTTRKAVSPFTLLLDNQVTGCLAVFRKDVIDLALPFPAPTSVSYHDHWLGFVALNVGQLTWLQDPVQDYVQHEQNVVGELSSGRYRTRLKGLRAASVADALDRVQCERWGWRETMAASLATRSCDVGDADIAAVATGRYSWRLLFRIARTAVSGQIDPLRGGALLLGATLTKFGRSPRGVK